MRRAVPLRYYVCPRPRSQRLIAYTLKKSTGSETPMSYQKLILTDPCITRGERAALGAPKVASV